jgi:O-methyltransferase involved in polyketide biosynthesis
MCVGSPTRLSTTTPTLWSRDPTRAVLAARLAAADLDPALPAVWLLEGLIGYLDRPAALRLLQVGGSAVLGGASEHGSCCAG